MAKVIDITEKLSFEENPQLEIKGTILEVNTDATTALKLMQLVGSGDEMTAKEVYEIFELIFPKKSAKKLEEMNLQFKDFTVVVQAAMGLLMGEGNESGER